MADKSGSSSLKAALVGQGISRSMTPAMHEAEGCALGLNYRYDLIDTRSPSFSGFSLIDIFEYARADGLVGLNITHPYKVEIIQHLDDLSENARKLRAVNTIVFRNGKAVGHNTDHSGFTTAFQQELFDVPKEKVLLLGAGGAGAAVGFALMECGVQKLQLFDTDIGKAKALQRLLLKHHPLVDITCAVSLDQSNTRSLNGIVNATPVGMAEFPGSAFPLELLSPKNWVSEIIYFPLETKLLAHARTLGCRVMPGTGMAIAQAVHSFELFAGHKGNHGRFQDTFLRISAARNKQRRRTI